MMVTQNQWKVLEQNCFATVFRQRAKWAATNLVTAFGDTEFNSATASREASKAKIRCKNG